LRISLTDLAAHASPDEVLGMDRAERYEGALEDVFDLQDRITTSVAAALEPTLRETEVRRAQAKSTTDLTSYDLLSRAYAAFYVMTPSSYDEAPLLLDRAVAIDPNNSTALALMAWCYVNRQEQTTPDLRTRGLTAARMALRVGRDDSRALSGAGIGIARFGDNLDEALTYTERAVTLNVNDAWAWTAAGWVSSLAGRLERSIECFTQANRLNPLDPVSYGSHAGVGFPLLFSGRYEDALASADKALSLEARFMPALLVKIGALAKLDRSKEAREAGRRLLVLRPDISISTYLEGTMLKLPDQVALIGSALRFAGIPE
jgi:adenylate cyclase